jgi:hypothetical protein
LHVSDVWQIFIKMLIIKILRRIRQASFMRQRRKHSRTSLETCTSGTLSIFETKTKIFSFNKHKITGLWLNRELLEIQQKEHNLILISYLCC